VAGSVLLRQILIILTGPALEVFTTATTFSQQPTLVK